MKKTADTPPRLRSLTPRQALLAVLLAFTAVPIISLLFPAADAPSSGTEIAFVVSSPGEGTDKFRPSEGKESRLLVWDSSSEDLRRLAPGLIPTGPPRIAFDGERILFSAREKAGTPAQVWEVKAQGSGLRRLTDCPTDCLTPDYLPDDRIVLAREMSGEFSNPVSSLFVLDPDLSRMEQITFNLDWVLVKGLAEDGRILMERHVPDEPGAKVLAVRPDGTELEEFLEPRHEHVLNGFGLPGVPAQVHEWPLPSREEDTEDIWPDGWEASGAVRLGPRPRPPVATSVVNPGLGHGWLLCLDVRNSGPGLNTAGGARVRVRDRREGKILGAAPVEDDGSFFLKVPADRLMLLELLDSEGRTIARQSHGLWVRPNERRGCVGCHEPRYLAPENRLPLAVMKPAFEIPPATENATPGQQTSKAP